MATVSSRPATELRERPIGEIASDLTRDLTLLVRQELELAKAEMTEKAKTAASRPGNDRRRGCRRAHGRRRVDRCAILVLAIFLPDWLSALLVGGALAGAAYLLVMRGKQQVGKAGSPIPEQTIDTVKEDLEWAKARATSARK